MSMPSPLARHLDADAPWDSHHPIIEVRDLSVGFGERLIMDGLSMDVRRGEILGVVGASGTGKSVLLRTIIGLVKQRRGMVKVFGHDMGKVSSQRRRLVESRWGVLFQHGALFSSLSVKQNIQFPMREYLKLSEELLEEMAMVKLRLVGLKPEAAERFPSELSGGMIKRAALARALALDPEIVFLDEPTSGLDPIGAAEFDELIATLQKTLGLTVFMVTHDLDSLAGICDRIAALGDGKVLCEGTLDQLTKHRIPGFRPTSMARGRVPARFTRREEMCGLNFSMNALKVPERSSTGPSLRGRTALYVNF